MEWWEYHSIGKADCDACVVEPVPCGVCGQGLMHTQFDESLVAVEGRCDNCQRVGVPEPEEVEV